jgi:hypothetical protein
MNSKHVGAISEINILAKKTNGAKIRWARDFEL